LRDGEYSLDPNLRVGVFCQPAGTGRRAAVYQGMKRVTLTVTVILLAVPAVAWGKTGVGFQTDPEAATPGQRLWFQVGLFHETPGPIGRERPYRSHGRPLVTFTSASGRVLRVRASALTGGAAHGYVRFPDRGPWQTTVSLGGHVIRETRHSGSFNVGPTRVVETPRTPAPAQPSSSGGGFTWWPVLFALPVLGAGAWLVRRRRPRGLGEIGAGGGA
jgi:hypothetical protein